MRRFLARIAANDLNFLSKLSKRDLEQSEKFIFFGLFVKSYAKNEINWIFAAGGLSEGEEKTFYKHIKWKDK